MQKLWWLLALAVVLSLFGLSPFQTTDVAHLIPVQTMVITAAETVQVDCGERLTGKGEDLAAALQALKAGAEGTVFLGTAQQIVVCGPPEIWLQLLQVAELRPAAQLYQTSTPAVADAVTAFLLQHRSPCTLLDLRAAQLYEEKIEVPCLLQGERGYQIVNGDPV